MTADCQPAEPVWTPTLPASGDQKEDGIWLGVGMALSAWGRYEAALGRLFAHLVTLDRASLALERAFGAVNTFEARRQMLKQAGLTYFAYHTQHSDLKRTFDLIIRDRMKASPVRNNIAHGLVLKYFSMELMMHSGFASSQRISTLRARYFGSTRVRL